MAQRPLSEQTELDF